MADTRNRTHSPHATRHSPPPLRLAMLGMWHTHADGLVRQIAAHPGEFTLVGFFDPDPAVVAARWESWAQLLPTLHVFDSPAGLLAEPLDAVIVDGRVSDNLAMARLAVETGRHVLLEKPAGDNLESFRALLASAKSRGLHVQLLYLFRYMSAVRELLRLVRSGEIGRPYSFRARLPKEVATYERFVEELRPYRGGIFFEMAGHMLDLMAAVLGPPLEVKSILAHHHDQPPQDYIDNAAAIFRCERGLGAIEVPAIEVVPSARRIEVYGTQGGCVIPHLGSGHLKNEPVQPIEVYRQGDATWRRIDLPAAPLQICDLREFAAVIAGDKPPEFSPEHDLAVQEALLTACHME